MIVIDKLCYQSKLRYENAGEKFAFAVITAVPFFTAVIFPLESTRAIFGLEEEYFTFTVVPVNLMALNFFSVNVSDVLLSFGVSTFTTHLYVFLLTFA